MADDLRDWLAKADEAGELRKVEGADWDLEIGCITSLNRKAKGKALLFDNIKGYPPGFRIVTCTDSTPKRVALILNIPYNQSKVDLIEAVRHKLSEWYANWNKFQLQVVKTGPVLENMYSGDDLDLFVFPTPKWHWRDGGRYIGTGDAVITKDPDTGKVNLGTYRVVIHDRKTLGINIVSGQHGRAHIEKYHAKGKACPIAVSIGHHPLVLRVASAKLPEGAEYSFLGAMQGEPVKVITEETTGLPIPANSEIVLAGWCPPDELRDEGIFGEWTGYYGGKREPRSIIKIERIYHRNDPIMLGQPPGTLEPIFYSALLLNELVNSAVPNVKAAYYSDIAGQAWIVVSIKQAFAGHAKLAAMRTISSDVGARTGRYVIVVDEDVDPTNIEEVIRAICFRVDPERDIDFVRDCWSTLLDPRIRKPAEAFSTSRAIINACKPYEWKEDFPYMVEDRPDVVARVREKWSDLF